MKTTYVLRLEDYQNLDKLVKHHIYFIKIKYFENACFLYVDNKNYDKLKKYFDIYNISLVKINGLIKYKILFKKYNIFLFSIVLGIIFVFLLSNIIFDVNIMTNKEELIEILNNELSENNISKYHFAKSFREKERIKNKILNDYKDKFEWIEIDRVGTRYYIRVLERIINKEENTTKYQNVVAKRNAIILEIKGSSGQIIKKVNDYVNRGDVIISGNITKKDEVKKTVKAEGRIYGETWYNVKVNLPRTYKNALYTGNTYQRLTLDIFNKKIYLFGKKKYNNEKEVDKKLLSSNILPFSLNKTTVYEVQDGISLYNYDEALIKGMDIARSKLLENLSKDSKILYQKKLKLYEENSTIVIEVFFKVYEDITDYEEIIEGD